MGESGHEEKAGCTTCPLMLEEKRNEKVKTRNTVREKRERLRVDERLTGRETAKLTKLCITVTYISIVKTRFIHTDGTRNVAFQLQHKISIRMSYLCLCLVNRMRFQITT
jgi:hypothetical protein